MSHFLTLQSKRPANVLLIIAYYFSLLFIGLLWQKCLKLFLLKNIDSTGLFISSADLYHFILLIVDKQLTFWLLYWPISQTYMHIQLRPKLFIPCDRCKKFNSFQPGLSFIPVLFTSCKKYAKLITYEGHFKKKLNKNMVIYFSVKLYLKSNKFCVIVVYHGCVLS